MGVVNTTYTFNGTDTVTSDKLNNLIDETTFTGDAIQGTTLQVVSGKLAVRGSGITSNEMAANSVTTTAITDGSVTPTKLSTNGPSWTSTATGGVFAVQQNAIEVGTSTVSDYACFVDFHSAATPTDFECRLRRDAGINGDFNIINTGTGAITLSSTGGVTFGSANMPIPSGSTPIYGIRAWVVFDMTRDASGSSNLNNTDRYIYSSGNISSITKTATGAFTVNFTTAMPNANYAFFGGGRDINDNGDVTIGAALLGAKSTSSIQLKCVDSGSNDRNSSEISVAFIG
jgi:hypothetical protein